MTQDVFVAVNFFWRGSTIGRLRYSKYFPIDRFSPNLDKRWLLRSSFIDWNVLLLKLCSGLLENSTYPTLFSDPFNQPYLTILTLWRRYNDKRRKTRQLRTFQSTANLSKCPCNSEPTLDLKDPSTIILSWSWQPLHRFSPSLKGICFDLCSEDQNLCTSLLTEKNRVFVFAIIMRMLESRSCWIKTWLGTLDVP